MHCLYHNIKYKSFVLVYVVHIKIKLESLYSQLFKTYNLYFKLNVCIIIVQ